MKVIVLGANGGLGRNTVDAALAAGHDVRALVRNPAEAAFRDGVDVVAGDASDSRALARAMTGRDIAFFCVNPPFSEWLERFPPLLDAAIEAARSTGTRLVFPANVWIFGRGTPGALVDERARPAPVSERGRLRAWMEERLAGSGVRFCFVRLPEFYGPHVVTLTARVFAAALADRRAIWPGPLDLPIELVFMPDGARAMVEAGCAPDSDGQTYHVPGRETTARSFVAAVYAAAGSTPRVLPLSPGLLRAAGLVSATARGAADIAHLWTAPVLLDGTKYRKRFGAVPQTPYEVGVGETIAWCRATRDVRLQR